MMHATIQYRILIYFVIVLVCVWSCNSNKSVVTKTEVVEMIKETTINLQYTNSYCGGAQPNDQILADLNKPKPFSDQMIYVKQGSKNILSNPILDSAKTNATGDVRFNLSQGTYCLIRKERVDKQYYNSLVEKYKIDTKNYSRVDNTCLDKWMAEVDFVFQVDEVNAKNFEFVIHNPCWWNSIPCVDYRGPLPN